MAEKEWIKCDSWDDLPVGEWLVKVSAKPSRATKSKSYHVAYCTLNRSGHKLTVVGGHFSFDMGNIVAYTAFDKYGEDE